MDTDATTPDARKPGRKEENKEDDVDDSEIAEDLFASPESGATTQKHTPSSQSSAATATATAQERSAGLRQTQEQHDAREARLRAELDRVRQVNRVIEGVTSSLTRAQDNMATVHRTVASAATLLSTWTRILSQTEHNQRLILDPAWAGATKDIEDMENEDLRRQQEVERRAADERRRKEEAQRAAEEEERRRAAAAAAPTKGVGRTRSTRGTRGYVGVGGQAGRGRGGTTTSTTASSRAGGGLGRTASTRGRGRGGLG